MLLPPLPERWSPRLRFVKRRVALIRIRSTRLSTSLANRTVICARAAGRTSMFSPPRPRDSSTRRPVRPYRCFPPGRRSSAAGGAEAPRPRSSEYPRRPRAPGLRPAPAREPRGSVTAARAAKREAAAIREAELLVQQKQ